LACAAAIVVDAAPASAAPTPCAGPKGSYGVGIAVVPKFLGTDETAISAYPGEIIDYNVTVFLRNDDVIVCPIFNGTLTLTLPNGNGPFTIATGISLGIGQEITYRHVPATKYMINTKDLVPAAHPLRVVAHAEVTATSVGFDTGPQDDAPVTATTNAPTFLLAPSTKVTITPNPATVAAGDQVTWTVTETNDTPPDFAPAPLSDVHADISADGGATTLLTLTSASPNFSGDPDNDGVLDPAHTDPQRGNVPAEVWTWTFTTNPTTNTTLTATGFALGPRGHPITFPAIAAERAAAPVTVTPPPPPPPTPPPTPPVTVAPPLLPATGASAATGWWAAVGFGLLASGAVLTGAARRRRLARG
jgi:LPXTG-motif cell wall-anchored protein